MPDYFTHMAFSKKVAEQIEIKDMNRFLVSSLIPDTCRRDDDENKEKCHFISKRIERTFKRPNLLHFFMKYRNYFNDEATLGIYSHLYLDKYYYLEFLPSIFDIDDEYMTNVSTGKKYKIWEEFFVPEGIYTEYTGMNKFLVRDYDLKLYELDFELEKLPAIDEFDYSKLAMSKSKMLNFYEEKGRYTGEFIEYDKIKKFLDEFSEKFVKHLFKNYIIENKDFIV